MQKIKNFALRTTTTNTTTVMKLSSYSKAFISGLAFFVPFPLPWQSYFRGLKQSVREHNCVTDMYVRKLM